MKNLVSGIICGLAMFLPAAIVLLKQSGAL